MARIYVIKAKVAEYTDQQGVKKTKYLDIGAVFDGQNGLSMKLDAIPTNWDGFAFLAEPQPRQGQQRPNGAGRPSGTDGGNRSGGGYSRGNNQGGRQQQYEDGGDDIPF